MEGHLHISKPQHYMEISGKLLTLAASSLQQRMDGTTATASIMANKRISSFLHRTESSLQRF
jgi:hypothetical protein